MKYHVKITNLEFDIELTPIEDSKPIEPPVEQPKIDWQELATKGGGIESGYTYYVPNSETVRLIGKTVEIKKNGDKPTQIIFGKEGDSNWNRREGQNEFLWDLGDNAYVSVYDIDLICAAVDDEVDPFKMKIANGIGQFQGIALFNLHTNMERALMYSVGDELSQCALSQNVSFKGYQWEEIKATEGSGIVSKMKDVNLIQVNPSHYFETQLNFGYDYVVSSVPFRKIENSFHSQQKGNACNILYVNGMTFYLPWGLQLGNSHPIRPIPNVGDTINLINGPVFMETVENSLQAGDVLEIEGKEYTVLSKDRPREYPYFKDAGYPIDINIGVNFGRPVQAKVIKSRGLELVDKESTGYMIFKDNKHFQTNINTQYDLDYYLASNPIGVLCYNQQSVGVDWENVDFNGGYYRQSNNGKGTRQVCNTVNVRNIGGNEFTRC